MYDYELVFIDNDSTDSTRPLLRELCKKNPKIKAIFNARNFGQFNSPYYGILQVTGDCVISMAVSYTHLQMGAAYYYLIDNAVQGAPAGAGETVEGHTESQAAETTAP